MNPERVCYGCFAEKEPGIPCPRCGFNENDEQPYLALPLGNAKMTNWIWLLTW